MEHIRASLSEKLKGESKGQMHGAVGAVHFEFRILLPSLDKEGIEGCLKL